MVESYADDKSVVSWQSVVDTVDPQSRWVPAEEFERLQEQLRYLKQEWGEYLKDQGKLTYKFDQLFEAIRL